MTTQAKGTFTFQTWDEQPCEEFGGGGKVTRARVTNVFADDIEGSSVVESVMAYRDDIYASFAGIERVIGRIGGRSGSFVLQQSGTFDHGVVKADWYVVPGTATGELSGMRGTGGYVWDNESNRQTTPFTLEYEIE